MTGLELFVAFFIFFVFGGTLVAHKHKIAKLERLAQEQHLQILRLTSKTAFLDKPKPPVQSYLTW